MLFIQNPLTSQFFHYYEWMYSPKTAQKHRVHRRSFSYLLGPLPRPCGLSLSLWGDKKYNDKAMMGSKTGWTATGCTGTATWKIGDTGKMLVVMWSIPFDQNWYKILSNHFESKNVNDTFVLMWWIPFDLKLVIPTPRMVFFFVHASYYHPLSNTSYDLWWPYERYSNWCAVGIMPVQEDTSDLWDKMYYGPELNFTRKEFYDSDPRYRYQRFTSLEWKSFTCVSASSKIHQTL